MEKVVIEQHLEFAAAAIYLTAAEEQMLRVRRFGGFG